MCDFGMRAKSGKKKQLYNEKPTLSEQENRNHGRKARNIVHAKICH